MTAPPVRRHPAQTKWIGKDIARPEDGRLLRGHGGYVDDLVLPGMLHVAVLTSPHAHARIRAIDISRAQALPGVAAVVTGAHAAELCNSMPDFGPDPTGQEWRCLAKDKARYQGEGIAAVAAETRALAEDALALIDVEYEILDVVRDAEHAISDGAPLVHESTGSNVGYDRTFTFGDVEEAFAAADLVVADRLHWHRSSAQPLETVGAVADLEAGTGMLTIRVNSVSFTSYLFMVANTLQVPSNKLDIVPMPAGGSFGSKFWAVKVAVIAGMLAKATGRPCKYIEDRYENLANSDHHGSDRRFDIELALTSDGTFTGLRIHAVEDYGAYMQFGVGQHGNALAQVVGPYRTGAVEYRVTAAMTNKCQQGAYRGFGSEVQNWALERIVDLAARAVGADPAQIRRRNFIQPDQFPYFNPSGNVYDSGDYEKVLDTALELFDYGHWRSEQARLRKEGRRIGIGICSAQERSVFSATEFWFWFDEPTAPVTSSPESITLSVDAMGNVTATLYSAAFWGQSPETVVTLLVCEELGVEPGQVSVVYSGTNRGLPATGPGGSRFTTMIAGAIEGASEKIRAKAARIAAHLLEVAPDDVEYVDGGVQVSGDPSVRKTLGEVAIMAHLFKHSLPEDVESGLEGSKVYDHPYTTMPSADRSDLGVFYPFMGHGCHIVAVEVDQETGKVAFLDYVAVHDCGTLVHPKGHDGQIHGGTAQGIGTALHEELVYADDGALSTAGLTTYLMPGLYDVPEVRIGHVETPSPYTPFGIKGGGEAGRMMAPAAISSAIDDALHDLDVRVRDVPMTPERLSDLIAAGSHPDQRHTETKGPGRAAT